MRVKRPTGAGFGKRAAARVGSGASPPQKNLKIFLKNPRRPIDDSSFSAILPPCQSNERVLPPSTAKMFIENLVR